MKMIFFCLLVAVSQVSAAGNGIYLGSRPSVSADGKKFVFEWADNIWMASTEGGEAHPLLTGGALYGWPVFCPDGKRVAFLSDADGDQKIFEQDLTCGTVRQLSFHSEATLPYAYTPDGKHLLCAVWRDHSAQITCPRAALLPTGKRAAERILFDAEATEPSLSPDGRLVLFARNAENLYRKRINSTWASQIWIYDIPAGRFTPVVQRPSESRTPLWMPDGKGFYYVSGQDGTMNVWSRELASGKERQITFFKDDSVIQPSLSQNGHTMVFRQQFAFYTIDPTADRPAPRRLDLVPVAYTPRPGTRRRYYNTCWNNDRAGDVDFAENGMLIAYTAGGDLFVTDTVLNEPTLIQGDSLTHERECVFAPDASALYYFSDRGDGTDLWVARPADSKRPWWENKTFVKTRLTRDNTTREDLRISPDGKRLAWFTPPGNLQIAGTNGIVSSSVKATGTGSYCWSGDSQWLAAALEDEYGNSDIWIVSAVNSQSPYNVSRHFRWDGTPCWSPDGKILAFVGERPDSKDKNLFYVWLNPEDEAAAGNPSKREKARMTIPAPSVTKNITKGKETTPTAKIDFSNLHLRVRRVRQGGENPFFSHDSRTLCYGANGGTYHLHIPDRLTPQLLTKTRGEFRNWYTKDDRLCWKVNNRPAHRDTILPVNVYQDTDIAAYQELGFRMAWARLRDNYYDTGFHGIDWNAIREKYLLTARNAASPSVYERVMMMMLGELNSSHLKFYRTDASKNEWQKKTEFQSWKTVTAHLGLRFDTTSGEKGWRVRDILPEGPADKAALGIRKGDVVLSIDGHSVTSGMDPTEVLNAREKKSFSVTIQSGTNAVRTVVLESESYTKARGRVRKAECEALRCHTHKVTKGKMGYLNIEQMNWDSYYFFEQEMFSEGYGREGLVIDVRNNPGGYIADALLNILCRQPHAYEIPRGGKPAYPAWLWKEPVWTKPIVVLCNARSGSNSEIFSHAVKTLKRGKVVGRTTGGNVIGTGDAPLLDLGTFRVPGTGCFLLDGTDMEGHGAVPDVSVEEDLNESARGVDVQLDAAIRVLSDEIEQARKKEKPVSLLFFRERK